MISCSWLTRILLGAAAIGAASGCSGNVASGEPDPTDPNAGGSGGGSVDEPGPGPDGKCSLSEMLAPTAPLRRLTRLEYNNTVHDLLGDDSKPATDFVADARPGMFDDNAAVGVSSLMASQYADAADKLARAAVAARLDSIAGCAAAAQNDACATTFVRDFGKRAYRRPLTDREQTLVFSLYKDTRTAGGSFADGVRVALTGILQSPNFVNHVERGGATADGVTALTSYERASRLSYFLWGTMPDDALFAAAESNELDTAEGVGAQAARMIDDARARPGIRSFFDQWLRLEKVDSLDRNLAVFPQWNPALRDAMRQETEAFVEHVMWQGDAKLTTLLQAPFSFVNKPLADVYGAKGVTSAAALVRVDLDPTQRAGLLTQASLLGITAAYDQTSPVHRGLQVRERFLCQHTPPPPPNVNVIAPTPIPGQTTRERFDIHREDPYCATCHILLDPIGLGFENYDPIGRYRNTDSGKPVDASGEVVATEDIDGPFNGALELTGKLAGSVETRDCMTGMWLGFGVAATPDQVECGVMDLRERFLQSGTDIKDLILAITTSDTFLHRRPVTASEVCQ